MTEVSLVVGVHRDTEHRFSKESVEKIRIIAGIGVENDAHAGDRVQHGSRVRADPTQPNLRQVHLMQVELFAELRAKGFVVEPGDLGENITTSGIDLLALGRGAILRIGEQVALQVTGLRNPCSQIEAFAPGLLKEVAAKTNQGVERKAGIMCIALEDGSVKPGDAIQVEPFAGPHVALDRV